MRRIRAPTGPNQAREPDYAACGQQMRRSAFVHVSAQTEKRILCSFSGNNSTVAKLAA